MTNQPNIVVFVSHDTGRYISPYGIPTVRTPNAERLADEGVLFSNYFCTAPGCCPSRAGMFSGRSPHAVGMLGQAGHWAGFRFSSEATHAATHFKKLGYDTMLLGLAHEVAGAGCPQSYFDGIGFDTLWGGKDAVTASSLKEKMPAILDAGTSSNKPFYLQIGTHETHKGYLKDGVERFDELGVTVPDSPALGEGPGTRDEFAQLQGSVNRLDEGLGYVMDVLEERGLSDNTLLVFTTDHGLPMPREKTTLYDRGIGVFCIMRYPGVFPQGETCDQLLSNVDLLPTLMEAAGGEATTEMEGISFYPALTDGNYQPREMIFAEKTFHTSYDPLRCVRTKRYKYIYNFESVRPENYCLDVYNQPVLLENLGALDRRPVREDELYDVEADPQETNNLAEEPNYQDVRHELAAAMVNWMTETADPLLEGPVATPRFYERIDWLKQHQSK